MLVANNVPLRANKKTIAGDPKKPNRSFWGAIPYGFTVLDGRVVVDPKETKVVRKILAHHQKGMSFNAISKWLNDNFIPSKLNKKWSDKTVASIIRRQKRKPTEGESNG